VLGLRPGAGDDEIRDAYRRLAKIHHPDRNPGDPQALATFGRLSESYAALRSRPRERPTGSTPLSVSATSRAPARRGSPANPLALADLAVGASAWVTPDAILVAPGRVAALRPSADGTAFPSADRVIRVERRADGHHVFLPPQPAARWPLSLAAETDGLAVAALWVGDRQDAGAGSTGLARMPLRLMTGTVAEMPVDAWGWVTADALAVDPEGAWSLDATEPVSRAPHPSAPVRVVRTPDGFHAYSRLPDVAWAPLAGTATAGRLPVVDLELGEDLDH
jgi:hypothetical protein